MVTADDNLPDDINALKVLVRQLQEEKDTQEQRFKAEIERLHEEFRLLLAKRFGPSSEKNPAQQLGLFNEAEAAVEQAEAPETETVSVPSHERKKPGRKPLPDSIERVEVLHDLPEEEKVCPHDGTRLERIGEEISEQLDIIPARVQVLRHVRPKYACPCCRQGVRTAKLPPHPIPKSIASVGLLAYIGVAKYVDGLPLYRLEAILQRIGVDIPRATLAGWMMKLGELILPLINLMRDVLLGHDVLLMDETTAQVLKEPGRTPTSKSYMWVQSGGPPDKEVILFDYDPSRSQAVPQRLLEGYRGYLQCDGYDGYAAVGRREGIVLVGCWAHARRKFDEAVKALGKQGKTKAGRATKGLAFIQKLYRIEKLAKGASPEERHRLRQEQAVPILEEMKVWLDKALPEVPPRSAVGKALHYLAGQWDKLVRYVDDGRISIDNNAAERAIRPFVIGRKNWLFSDTPNGAHASARLYSLISTAKANGHEPYRYLRYILEKLPAAITVEDFEALLPFNLDPASLER